MIQFPVMPGKNKQRIGRSGIQRDPDIPTILILLAGEVKYGADDFATLIPVARHHVTRACW